MRILVILLLALGLGLEIIAVMNLWYWALVPILHVPEIGFGQAGLIMILIELFTDRKLSTEDRARLASNDIAFVVERWVAKPLGALVIGAIVHVLV